MTKADVAEVADQATNFASDVTMINAEVNTVAARYCAWADRTVSALGCKHAVVIGLCYAVSFKTVLSVELFVSFWILCPESLGRSY